MKPTVFQIALAARSVTEEFVRLLRAREDDLCGACAEASLVLTGLLQAFGHPAQFVQGKYDRHQEDHCWVDLEGVLIDITATQFLVQDRVHLVKNPLKKMAYNELRRGERAEEFVRVGWFVDSQLVNEMIQSALRGLRRRQPHAAVRKQKRPKKRKNRER